MSDQEWFQVVGGRSVQADGVEREFKKLVAKLRRLQRDRDEARAEVERLRDLVAELDCTCGPYPDLDGAYCPRCVAVSEAHRG